MWCWTKTTATSLLMSLAYCAALQVTYMARVNPVTGDMPVPAQSASSTVQLTITGC
jgi:hypothetical protein